MLANVRTPVKISVSSLRLSQIFRLFILAFSRYDFCVSRPNRQITQKKSLILLPGSDPERERVKENSQKAFLTPELYSELLCLWVHKGGQVWLSRRKIEGQYWRSRFLTNLKGNGHRWRSLIFQGLTRPTEFEREDIIDILEKAGNDPLMFLNLCGVPPFDVLGVLEYREARMRKLAPYRERLRQKATREAEAKIIEKAGRALKRCELLVASYIDSINGFARMNRRVPSYSGLPVPEKYPNGDWLRAIARIMRDSAKIGLIPPGADKKGGPSKVDFAGAVRDLLKVCNGQIKARLENRVTIQEERDQNGIEVARVLVKKDYLWGAVAAILMAAFPEWFKRGKNPIRNMKNASKIKFQR